LTDKTEDVLLRGFHHSDLAIGIMVAKQFVKEHPNSFGQYSSVFYGKDDGGGWKAEMMAYRTKTRIVVRWIKEVDDGREIARGGGQT
jgi:hypothetical protein